MLLKIDQEFKNLIPPLTHEDRVGLENNIKANGCETPITVWDGTIIDGHNRYEICVANGIPFEVKEISFADRDDAKIWMIKHELEWKGRKITPYIRTSLALKMKDIIQAKAKANQVLSAQIGDLFNPKKVDSVPQNSAKPKIEPIETRKEIAKLADVSHDTVDRVKVIEAKATEEQKQALREDKVSINKVYQEIKKQEDKPQEKIEHFIETTNDECATLPITPSIAEFSIVTATKEETVEKTKKILSDVLEKETPCPLSISPCPKSHDLCDHWYNDGCNHDWDTLCSSGACSMPSVKQPNAFCPYCNHELTIDYENYKVIK